MAQALNSLGNTVRGVSLHLLQQAVTACILYRAYFAAETWWPGRSRTARTPTRTLRPVEPSGVPAERLATFAISVRLPIRPIELLPARSVSN